MGNENDLLSAVTDGRDLWPHNRDVINDPQVEGAVLTALSTGAVTESEETYGVKPHPRLVFCDPEVVAFSLIEALTMNVLWSMHAPCDRCERNVQPASRLWVPAGGSVVEVHCCLDCASELQRDYPNIVWR